MSVSTWWASWSSQHAPVDETNSLFQWFKCRTFGIPRSKMKQLKFCIASNCPVVVLVGSRTQIEKVNSLLKFERLASRSTPVWSAQLLWNHQSNVKATTLYYRQFTMMNWFVFVDRADHNIIVRRECFTNFIFLLLVSPLYWSEMWI